METENAEQFEEAGIGDAPTESISEIREAMYFTQIKKFGPIPLEDMLTKYEDDVFWYVFDETTERVVAHRVKGQNTPVTYLFQERKDAEEWRWIGSKSGTHQDHKLIVVGDKFSTIVRNIEDKLGEFEVLAISHTEAQNVFENYPELKLTREVEERRKATP